MGNIFEDWGTKPTSKGISYPKRKAVISKSKVTYDKRVKHKPEVSGGISYGTRSKWETSGGISYKKAKPVKGEVVGGIGHGTRAKWQPAGGIEIGKRAKPEPAGGIEYGKRYKPTTEKETFGLGSKSGVFIVKNPKKVVPKKVKATKPKKTPTYSFGRKSPLARKLRKIF